MIDKKASKFAKVFIIISTILWIVEYNISIFRNITENSMFIYKSIPVSAVMAVLIFMTIAKRQDSKSPILTTSWVMPIILFTFCSYSWISPLFLIVGRINGVEIRSDHVFVVEKTEKRIGRVGTIPEFILQKENYNCVGGNSNCQINYYPSYRDYGSLEKNSQIELNTYCGQLGICWYTLDIAEH